MEIVFYVVWVIFWFTVGGILGQLLFEWAHCRGARRRAAKAAERASR